MLLQLFYGYFSLLKFVIFSQNFKIMESIKRKRGRPKKAENRVKSDYLNIQELADMLQMSVSHIYTMTSTKKIPHIKLLNKKLLFDKSEIKNWLKSKSVSVK